MGPSSFFNPVGYYPYGISLKKAPTGRCSDGYLMIDYLSFSYQATDLLQKLTLESKSKTHDAPEIAKKPSAIQYGLVNGVEPPKVQIPSSERSITPVRPEYMDHNIWYLHNGYPSSTYYYRGYDDSIGEWDDYSRYLNPEGLEVPHGVYGDMYHHGYGYTPYGAYPSSGSVVPSLGHDRQMYGAQHYQCPSPTYFQPQAVPNGTYSSNSAPTSHATVTLKLLGQLRRTF